MHVCSHARFTTNTCGRCCNRERPTWGNRNVELCATYHELSKDTVAAQQARQIIQIDPPATHKGSLQPSLSVPN